jgi:diguanylate cyclase (GGDEF)-like protein/PAS domain S-box-containing protein
MPFFSDPVLYQSVLEDLPIGVYVLDRERRVRFWNRGAEHITGYLAHEVVGQACSGPLQHCDTQGRVLCGDRCPVTATFMDGHPHQTYAFSLHREGHRAGMRIQTLPLHESHDVVAGVAVILEEAPDMCVAGSFGSLMYGCLDPITGVPSQRLTRAMLAESLRGLEETHGGFGVLFIQIQGLKEFSARHGAHSIVPFLHATAQTIRHSLGGEDFVGRWGEHEFLAVLHSPSPVTVAATAETIWHLLSQSEITWWGDRFLIEAAVAHAVARPGDQLETLLNNMNSPRATQAAAASHGPSGSGHERG